MKFITFGLILTGSLLASGLLFSQAQQNQSSPKSIQTKMQPNTILKEYILLVYLPLTYTSDNAAQVRAKWTVLLDEWKADGTYVTSFVYPTDGHLVSLSGKLVTQEAMKSDNFKLISNMILKAADPEAAVLLAKRCPVLQQGGKIEVREIQPRPTPKN